jgi:amino acid adenylation domain-containing protein
MGSSVEVEDVDRMATAGESANSFEEWMANSPARPGSSLVARFEAIASLHPDRVAVVLGGRKLTFAQLNAAANRMAHRLLALSLPEKSFVAIWLDRSPEVISAMLGVLKAGCTYLPLEPTYPVARIAQTLEDAHPAALITDRVLAATLPAGSTPCLMFPDQEESRDTNPGIAVDPASPAYIIYTSGSTGKPKGVLVSHFNVTRLFDETQFHFQFSQSDVWTMFHSFAFDFSVWEIWGPLLTGAKLVIVPFETTRSPEEFYRLLSNERVTVLNQTPSAFSLLSQVEERGLMLPLALRLLIFGGDTLKFSALKSWFSRHADTAPQLVNCYGITETTVHVTIRNVSAKDAQSEQESLIGDPIPDLQLYLLDETGSPVAEGQSGELCVGGAGVSLGYLNRPELSAERFTSNPFAAGRLYHSGDLARRRSDGELVYMGRRDEQVKINGFRIELGEVEAALCVYPGISEVCVVPHTDDSGAKQLAAYFVSIGNAPVDIPALAKSLTQELPAQMLPACYTQLASFPLTHNGKTDRKALPSPMRDNLFAASASREPETEIEEAVLALVRNAVGVQTIGMDDNFFTIGGHSLLGTQFVMRARQAFGVKLTLRDIFETESVAEISQKIEELILDDLESMSDEDAIRLAGGDSAAEHAA